MLISIASTSGTQSLAIVPTKDFQRQSQHNFRAEQLLQINKVSLNLNIFIGQRILRLKLSDKCVSHRYLKPLLHLCKTSITLCIDIHDNRRVNTDDAGTAGQPAFCLRLANDESPIDLAELAAFARCAQADEETPARMRAYAESHMSWQGVLAQVLERVGIECPER